MSVLRPKFQLNHAAIQGDRYTIPAEEFTQLTGRRYPYARLGTRAPNSNPGNPGNTIVRAPYGYVRDGAIVRQIGGMKPKFTLDKAVVQGVMPATTYRRLTGKLTTAPQLPPGARVRTHGLVRAPALQFDWSTFFWGAVGGGIVTLAMVYGIIPALAEWGAAAIKKRY